MPMVIETLRPYGEDDLSSRVKVVWCGAEVKGRERLSTWDGRLTVHGNRIVDMAPINFWNPDSQPALYEAMIVDWRSITTGGLSGLILTLEDPLAGQLAIETAQGKVTYLMGEVGLEPRVWPCGGLGKRIEAYRLPEEAHALEFGFTTVLENLHPGDNPIYVRVTQEDGHMAWTSPIYVESTE